MGYGFKVGLANRYVFATLIKYTKISINPLARGSDLKTIHVHREDEIGTAAARVYYKRSLG